MKPISTLRNFLLLIAVFLGGHANGATISWSVFNITGLATDVSTLGTLVEATSGSTSVSTTVNGVTFAAGQILDSTTRNRTSTIPTLSDSSYQTLLQSSSSTTNSSDQSITFSGLTVGRSYQIQIWASDTTYTDSGLVLNNGSGATNPGTSGHTTLLYQPTTGAPGQYALGTFVADATSQAFAARRFQSLNTSPAGTAEPRVNAIQLRDITAIPEPSSAASLASSSGSACCAVAAAHEPIPWRSCQCGRLRFCNANHFPEVLGFDRDSGAPSVGVVPQFFQVSISRTDSMKQLHPNRNSHDIPRMSFPENLPQYE